MQALLIVNPVAGRGTNRERADRLKETFRQNGYRTRTVYTSQRCGADELVLRNAAGSELVVCCGGDGTLSETAGGILRLDKRPKLAYLPGGTTNDFAGSVGLSADPRQAARDIMDGACVKLDTGDCGGKPFIYVASFGAFTKSSYTTPQALKNCLGKAAYLLKCVADLREIKPMRMRITDDSGTVREGDYAFGSVSNTTSIGGFLKFDQRAVDLSDGRHEVLLIRYPRSIGELKSILTAVRGGHYDSDCIDFFRTSSLQIESDLPTVWSLDGERAFCPGAVTLKNNSASIDFVMPASYRQAS